MSDQYSVCWEKIGPEGCTGESEFREVPSKPEALKLAQEMASQTVYLWVRAYEFQGDSRTMIFSTVRS